jgi:hypothetical protein
MGARDEQPAIVANALLAAASVAAAKGDAMPGARLLGYAEATIEALRLEHSATAVRVIGETRAALRALLSDSKFAALEREGRAWPEERALREFESVPGGEEAAGAVLGVSDVAL